jgi:thioredoxin-like negative regulator of GroEL
MTHPTSGMILLQTQDQFEQLIGRQITHEPLPPISIVYFTANWCGACKRLDFQQILGKYPNIAWWKCDVDINDYTLGYCGLRSIPSFVLIHNQTILGSLSNNQTETVINWIQEKLKMINL